ncbi:ATP-binding protein [Actinoplanes sp. NPDC020271]|uniref:ATP-binding protein n=1 Tax=Actinoplanes sp. NPDC020271 TaxID=3363896 RepID=UPI003793F2BF
MQSAQVRVSCDDRVLHDPESVLAVALHAYIAIDETGQVVAWNPAAQALFGYSFDQACGRLIADLIIPVAQRTAHREALARCAAGGPAPMLGRRIQLAALHRDGHELPVELTVTATEEPGRRLFHAFAQDVTLAQRVSRFAAAEAAVSRGLAEAGSSGVAAARVVAALAVRMGWPVAELWLADEARQMVTCAARHVNTDLRLGAFGLNDLEPGVGLPGRVYAQAAPDWIPDLAADVTSFRSRAGARIGLHVAVGVPVSSGGHTIGALCVYGDRIEDPEDTLVALLSGIAAQVGQYLERRRAEELAVELAKTKDEFLALVTHELRNPLSVITAATALLEEDLEILAVGEQRQQLQAIGRNAQRLSVIAEDLLDLARLEAGHIAIDPVDTDLAGIIGDAVAAHRSAASSKDLTMIADLPERLEVYGDPHRLRQVADNLVSNAIKYTPAGGTVTLTAALDASADTVVWTVADTGIGIPAAERMHLFRRFYRTSIARDLRIPGTGLGLVITRTIIERHHGTIVLSDTVGPGSTFTIRLPRYKIDPARPDGDPATDR